MRKRTLVSIAFIVPSVIIVGIFVYAFIAWTLAASFTNWNTLLPNWSFAGLKNYIYLFTQDMRFHMDLVNNFIFLPFFVLGTMILGFFLATLLNSGVKFEAFFRTVFLLPMAISLVVSGVIWIWIYDPTNGALASLFQIFHLPAVNWLGSMTYALPAIIIATIWQYTGFTTSIYLAGLRGIPQEVLEAARLDGAHGLRLYWNIIIPMVQSSTVTAFVLMVQLSLQMFDIVWVMTQGGPAFATDMPAVYMFIAGFKQNFVARGAAIAIIIFALTLVVVIPYLFTAGKITEEEA
ncbi:carbohydrate ABC transporter permease [Athalassotoga sp.]|uniref:carbohydrate ABC transporter permease n=1 Tax=Athalassotoga sp. TaxID=2022597 RepID=UPI003CFDB157